MKKRMGMGVIALLAGAAAVGAGAQESAPPPVPAPGAYAVQQSYSAGYRFSNIQGSTGNYDTMVNLHSGLRLLDGSLGLHAAPGHAWLDSLLLTADGLGGEPESVVRLRAAQGEVYQFSGTWRRDENIFDYNLLTNPLNPTTYSPATGISTTLHQLDLSHRLQNYELRLFPRAAIGLRLGYARNVQTGPANTTLHGGVDTRIDQSYRTTMNSYQAGVDFRPFSGTVVSYDQFLEYFKNDTAGLGIPTPYMLPGGQPVDLGFVFTGTTPCANAYNPATTPPTANPLCKGLLSFSQVAPMRTALPTERLSLHSELGTALVLNGAFSYNSGQTTVVNFRQFQNGIVSSARGSQITAASNAHRVDVLGYGTLVWTIASNLRLSDSLNLYRFENPGSYVFNQLTLFSQAPLTNGAATLGVPFAVFTPANCPAPYTAATCPQHASTSAADVQTGTNYEYLANNTLSDTALLSYDFTPRAGAHVGYRYSHQRVADGDATFATGAIYFPGSGAAVAFRGNCAKSGGVLPAACTLNSDGSVSFTPAVTPQPPADLDQTGNIHGSTYLLGAWLRPGSKLQISTDEEFYTADHAFDRMQPRSAQSYAVQTQYAPSSWLRLQGNVNLRSSADNAATVNQTADSRNFNVALLATPRPKLNFTVGFNEARWASSALECFSLGTSPVPSDVFPCPIAASPVKLGANATYNNQDHFLYGDGIWEVASGITLRLGWAGSFVRGNALLLNPLAPTGSLQFDDLRPRAGIDLKLAPQVMASADWNYFDYGQLGGLPIGLAPIALDNFHAHMLTLALRYSH
jgi:hypothetical protein